MSRCRLFRGIDFFDEVDFLSRQRYFPGFIGGHCVIPNIQLLLRIAPSAGLAAILESKSNVRMNSNLEPTPTISLLRNHAIRTKPQCWLIGNRPDSSFAASRVARLRRLESCGHNWEPAV
jgi:hypothetical protein